MGKAIYDEVPFGGCHIAQNRRFLVPGSEFVTLEVFNKLGQLANTSLPYSGV